MKRKKPNKPVSLLMVFLIYALAYMVAFWSVMELKIPSSLWQAAYANLIATVVIYFFSKFMDNSSLYDPYWSLTPILITFYWLLPNFYLESVSVYQWIIFGLIAVWGLRLTLNWMLRWKGFADEDWRYVLVREKTKHWYWPVSLVGIHLLPSVIIFLGILPVYFISGTLGNPHPAWFIAALVILISGILLEAIADFQLLKFRSDPANKNKILKSGVWGRMQYPNYTGEILFWWGIYLYAISFRLALWRLFLGPVLVTFLFLLVSIPLMEKHLKQKQEKKQNKKKMKNAR
jgi:steroid 5-alpha reductase family enzyme